MYGKAEQTREQVKRACTRCGHKGVTINNKLQMFRSSNLQQALDSVSVHAQTDAASHALKWKAATETMSHRTKEGRVLSTTVLQVPCTVMRKMDSGPAELDVASVRPGCSSLFRHSVDRIHIALAMYLACTINGHTAFLTNLLVGWPLLKSGWPF